MCRAGREESKTIGNLWEEKVLGVNDVIFRHFLWKKGRIGVQRTYADLEDNMSTRIFGSPNISDLFVSSLCSCMRYDGRKCYLLLKAESVNPTHCQSRAEAKSVCVFIMPLPV